MTLDRRGVALPLALLGLVIVSLMVTSALLTSTTEAAISEAQTDATRSLYQVEAAVEGFIAEQARSVSAENPAPLRRGTFPFAPETGGRYTVSVALMRAVVQVHPRRPGWRRRTETYAISATRPDGRGRSVGALYTVHRDMPPAELAVDTAPANDPAGIPDVMLPLSDAAYGCAPGNVTDAMRGANTRVASALVGGSTTNMTVDERASFAGSAGRDGLADGLVAPHYGVAAASEIDGGRMHLSPGECPARRAESALASTGPAVPEQQFGGRTFAWFEVVR